jgi:hypothetical protein
MTQEPIKIKRAPKIGDSRWRNERKQMTGVTVEKDWETDVYPQATGWTFSEGSLAINNGTAVIAVYPKDRWASVYYTEARGDK